MNRPYGRTVHKPRARIPKRFERLERTPAKAGGLNVLNEFQFEAKRWNDLNYE